MEFITFCSQINVHVREIKYISFVGSLLVHWNHDALNFHIIFYYDYAHRRDLTERNNIEKKKTL